MSTRPLASIVCAVLLAGGCDESPSAGRVDGGVTASDGGAGEDGATTASDGGLPPSEAGSASDGGAGLDGATAPDGGEDCPGGLGNPPATGAPPIPGSWQLTFEEHFDGPGLDDARWKVGQNWAGFNGKGATDPRNVAVACGHLTMTAEKRALSFGKDAEYATGEISTFKRFRQKHGYFEARIKYAGVSGLWPAFWLMPDRGKYGNVDNNRTSYLKFDLSGLGPSVEGAQLELHVEAAAAGVQNVALMRVADDGWSEATITGEVAPSLDPQWVAMRLDPQWTEGDMATFDVTEDVNRQLAGDKVLSLALVDGFSRARRVSFGSKEASEASHRPRLVLAGGALSGVVASEDASVGEGAAAAKSFGAEAQLHVEEQWGDTTTTYDGGMEIDIMESLGTWGPHRTSHAMHWDGYGADHDKQGSGHIEIPPTADGFHVYGLSWQPEKLRFFIDGKQTFEWSNARVPTVPGFIILSLQVGGWADKYGDNRVVDDAALPATAVFDYVRVWSGAPD